MTIMDSSATVPRASRSTGPGMVSTIVERIVEQNLGVYRASPSRLQEDVSQEAQVASDYRGRLVYELLQNADDAMESQATEADRVVFVMTDDAVWMANSGRPLTDADVRGLCGLGASSKVDTAGTKRASIGHKGLGFKSVLEITDSPAVYSRTISFRLGASEAWPHVGALWDELDLPRPPDVPAMRFPSLIGEADDEGRWPALRDRGLNTAFRFPFREDLGSLDQRKALTDLLLGLPLTTVLFLKHLESVQVRVEQTERSESSRVDGSAERSDEMAGGFPYRGWETQVCTGLPFRVRTASRQPSISPTMQGFRLAPTERD